MPVSRALSSPDISHSVGLRGTWVSHVCGLSRFLGSKGAHRGLVPSSRFHCDHKIALKINLSLNYS